MNASDSAMHFCYRREELERSIDDLSKFLPYLKCVSVVPAGVTKYRDGAFNLETFNRQDGDRVLLDTGRKVGNRNFIINMVCI